MPQFLVTIHRPHGYDPQTAENEAMRDGISALNREMVTAGARVFVGGLKAPDTAKSLRPQADGEVTISDGLYLDASEHVGGLWVLETATLDEAVEWGRQAALACRASVEVRPFHP